MTRMTWYQKFPEMRIAPKKSIHRWFSDCLKDFYWCVLRREFLGMIHFITSNFIIPATPSNPSIPYVKRTSKYIGDVIIPTDELIFFRWVGISPTNLSCLLTSKNIFHEKQTKQLVEMDVQSEASCPRDNILMDGRGRFELQGGSVWGKA